jgi:hypothetical protein
LSLARTPTIPATVTSEAERQDNRSQVLLTGGEAIESGIQGGDKAVDGPAGDSNAVETKRDHGEDHLETLVRCFLSVTWTLVRSSKVSSRDLGSYLNARYSNYASVCACIQRYRYENFFSLFMSR